MLKIKQMNKMTIGLIRAAVEENLKEFCEESEIAVHCGKASYTDSSVEIRVTFSVMKADGTVETPEKRALDTMGKMYGIDATYGQQVLINGKEVRVIGLCPKRSKYPVLVQDATTEKRTLFTVESINNAVQNMKMLEVKS